MGGFVPLVSPEREEVAGLWAYWAQDLLDLVPFGILVASPFVLFSFWLGNAFSPAWGEDWKESC